MEKNSPLAGERIEYADLLNSPDAEFKQVGADFLTVRHTELMSEFLQKINLAHDLREGKLFQRFNKFYEYVVKKINSHNVFSS